MRDIQYRSNDALRLLARDEYLLMFENVTNRYVKKLRLNSDLIQIKETFLDTDSLRVFRRWLVQAGIVKIVKKIYSHYCQII
jgi:hypothetical protein